MKPIFIYGVPIAIAALSLWFITQSNKFILNHFDGLDSVGLVGVAYNMTFPILMTLFAIITIAAFPRIINLYEDKIDIRPVVSRLTGYYMLIALPLVIVMSLYANDLIIIFANEKYARAAVLLPYLSFSAFFLSFTDYTTMQYHLANRTYILTIIKIISGVIGLSLNFVLIKYMGFIGVGVATLASNILYFILSIAIVIPGLEWHIPFKKACQILLCFIPAGIVYCLLKTSSVLPVYQIVALLIVYYFVYALSEKFMEVK
jgi:O-antigen/teichoic acid export membrane protein